MPEFNYFDINLDSKVSWKNQLGTGNFNATPVSSLPYHGPNEGGTQYTVNITWAYDGVRFRFRHKRDLQKLLKNPGGDHRDQYIFRHIGGEPHNLYLGYQEVPDGQNNGGAFFAGAIATHSGIAKGVTKVGGALLRKALRRQNTKKHQLILSATLTTTRSTGHQIVNGGRIHKLKDLGTFRPRFRHDMPIEVGEISNRTLAFVAGRWYQSYCRQGFRGNFPTNANDIAGAVGSAVEIFT